MSGFKNFVLRGNLVDLAVAVIIATSFGAVVTTFTEWLTAQLGTAQDPLFDTTPGSFGNFANAVIAFLILAAVVYFFVVVPYTKARERFFPEEASGPTEVQLLTEIRDSLATKA